MQREHICRTNRGKLPTDYLPPARVFLPKASVARNWVIRNLRRIQFAWYKKNNFVLNSGAKLKIFHSSNLLGICPSLFEIYLNKANYSIYKKLSRDFSVAGFSFWGEIKPPTPVLLTHYFSAALKALVPGNLLKLFKLDFTFAQEVCRLGIKMKKIWQSSYSFHYPQQQTARANVMANLTRLNKLPNASVNSSCAQTPPPPRPRADPPALTFLFFALDGKFPGLGTLELSNLTGWGRSRLTSKLQI